MNSSPLAAAAERGGELLADAMGTPGSYGFPACFDKDPSADETANFAICDCGVDAGVVSIDDSTGTRTFRCWQCGAESTAGPPTTAAHQGGGRK